MNQRANLPHWAGARWAGLRLALSLLPGVAISATLSVAPEIPSPPGSRPYLSAIGAPALRFGEAPPPPDLRPAAGAPPQPKEETPVDSVTTPEPAHLAPESVVAPANTPSSAQSEPAKRAPAPILPDDTRAKVRAEDFLPYFQFPGSASSTGDVTVIVPGVPAAPTPAPLPPSSATYRQQ